MKMNHKAIIISLMAILFFIETTQAETDSFSDIGIGYNMSECPLTSSPTAYTCKDGGNFYIQVKYPGNTLIQLHWNKNTAAAGTLTYLNCSSSSCSFYDCGAGGVTNEGGGIYNSTYSCSSNTGIYLIHYVGTAFTIYPELSLVTYVSNDFKYRTYPACGIYTVPAINKYYPVAGVHYGAVSFHQYNSTPFFYGDMKVYSSPTGLPKIQAWNTNISNLDEESTYFLYMNISAANDLNFTYTYQSTTKPNINQNVTFNVGVSAAERVTGIAWYAKDLTLGQEIGSLITTNPPENKETTLVLSSPIAHTFLIEAQIEDTTCGEYVTTNWTISVGDVGSIQGYVINKTCNTTIGNIQSANVIITNAGSYYLNVLTNVNGYYGISGMPTGNYTITFSAAGKTDAYNIAILRGYTIGLSGILSYPCNYSYSTTTTSTTLWWQQTTTTTTTTTTTSMVFVTTTTSTTTTTTLPACTVPGTTHSHYRCLINLSRKETYTCNGTTWSLTGNFTTNCAAISGGYCKTNGQCYVPTTTTSTMVFPVYPEKTFDCTNLTGKVIAGDLAHASACSLIIPLGSQLFMTGVIFFITLMGYAGTRNFAGAALVGGIWVSVWIEYLPPIWMQLIGLVFVLGIASILIRVLISKGQESVNRSIGPYLNKK